MSRISSRLVVLFMLAGLLMGGCSTGFQVANDASATPTSPTSMTAKPDTTPTASKKIYKNIDGWQIEYPKSWDREEYQFIKETATGKTVSFSSVICNQSEVETWIKSEIERKLDATEADNTLVEPLRSEKRGDMLYYTYTIESKMDGATYRLVTVVYFDGERRYKFHTSIPPVNETEFNEIIESFRVTQ